AFKVPGMDHLERFISPDGSRIAGGRGGMVRVYDARTGQETFSLNKPAGRALNFSPDGSLLAVTNGGPASGKRVYDLRTGKEVLDATGAEALIVGAFSPDGSRVAFCGLEGLRVYDMRTGKAVVDIKTTESDWPTQTTFSPDGASI